MVSRRLHRPLLALAEGALATWLLLSSGCGEQAPGPEEPVAASPAKLRDPSRQWVETQKLLSNDALPYTYYGSQLALSGDTALIGAYRADHDRGAAYVVVRQGDRWVQQARLTSDDGVLGDTLGTSIALSGDRAVLGATLAKGNTDFSGAAYVFERRDSKWHQTAKLVADDAEIGSGFGHAVAMTEDAIFVGGAPQVDGVPFLETAYVFTREGEGWTLSQKLSPGDTDLHAFGFSMAADRDTLVVGAPGDSEAEMNAGAAYVYTRSSGTWALEKKLLPSVEALGGLFGFAVAIRGDTLIAGAPFADAMALQAGAAYVFARDPAVGWQEQAQLTANDEAPKDYNRFGAALALSDDTAVVGRFFTYNPTDPGITFTDKGSAYMFTQDGDTWSPFLRLEASDSFAGNLFGQALAIDNDTLFVGASEVDTPTADDPGATYVLSLRSIQGTACATASECKSGFCVDGVCCDSVCDGACEACSAEKKGGGEQGVCGPVPDGTNPGGVCGLYMCSAGACLTACEAARDCVESYYCNPASKRCEQIEADIGDRGGCACRGALGAPGEASPWPIAVLLALLGGARRGRARRSRRARGAGAPVLLVALGSAGCNAGAPHAEAVSAEVAAEPVQFKEQAELYAGDERESDQFGSAIAASGDTMVVGAPFWDADPMTMQDAGAAYVFVRAGGMWQSQGKLVAETPEQGGHFGAAVAIHGDTILVGAPLSDLHGIDAGAAYVFVRAGDKWTLQQTLTPAGEPQTEQFGLAVALFEDTAVIGAPLHDEGALVDVGKAYVFARAEGQWNMAQEIPAPGDAAMETLEDDRFGSAVALSSDKIVVGAPHEDDPEADVGAAYVYTRQGDAFGLTATLKAKDGKANDSLGERIALDGDTLVLGVPAADGQRGAVYVARRGDDGAFGELIKLSASDGVAGDAFGSSVALLGDALLAGAPAHLVMGPGSGAAHLFWWQNGAWREQVQIDVQDELGGDQFGGSVALLDRAALVGAPQNDVLAKASGAVYALLLGTPTSCLDETHSAAARSPDELGEAAVTDCSPHRCDEAGGVCQVSCTETRECAPGFFCDPEQSACVLPPRADIGPKGGCRAAAGSSPEGVALMWLCVGLALWRRRALMARRSSGRAPR